MAQRGDFSLRLWSLRDLHTPLRQFFGHTDIITAFDWRCHSYEHHKDFQLVTWSKDQTLRLWPVEHSVQKLCQRSSVPVSIQLGASDNSAAISPGDKFSPSSLGIKDLAQ